jgi:hypothetical protein
LPVAHPDPEVEELYADHVTFDVPDEWFIVEAAVEDVLAAGIVGPLRRPHLKSVIRPSSTTRQCSCPQRGQVTT